MVLPYYSTVTPPQPFLLLHLTNSSSTCFCLSFYSVPLDGTDSDSLDGTGHEGRGYPSEIYESFPEICLLTSPLSAGLVCEVHF